MSVHPMSRLTWAALAWLCVLVLGCRRVPGGGGEVTPAGGEETLTLMLRGDPTAGYGKFQRLFKERCQGRVEFVGHHLPAARNKEIDANNRRVVEEVARRYGPDRLEELCREAGLPKQFITRE